MESKVIIKETSPLCYLPNGRLVCYRKGEIIVMNNGKEEGHFPIRISGKEKVLGWSRYATRLLRFGVRAAIALDDEHILLSKGNTIHELDLTNGTLSKGWFCGEGIRPLIFTEVKGIKGFDDGIYFGGYLGNMDKKPVHIYRRVGADEWQVVYTFAQGMINHVHNVVADPYRQCLWIFTGDFGKAAAIWKVTDGFKKVERVVCNNQKYRACVVNALPEGLLYATDAPFADDFIYLLDPETMETKELKRNCQSLFQKELMFKLGKKDTFEKWQKSVPHMLAVIRTAKDNNVDIYA